MIRSQLYALENRFNGLSLRERVFIAIAIGLLLLMSAQWLVFAPTIVSIRAERKQQQDIGVQREQLMQELASAQARLAQRQQIAPGANQQQQLDALNQELSTLAEAMVPPEKMADLLRDVLTRHQGLQLIELLKLPVLPLATPATKTAAPTAVIALYEHKLQLRLRGSYADTLRYLQALEQSGWRLYWQTLDYQVEDYPHAQVSIELATLGKEEGWIGG